MLINVIYNMNNEHQINSHYKHKYDKYKKKYFDVKLEENFVEFNMNKSLQREIFDWINLFRVLKNKYPGIRIYLKGGTILGFQVIKLVNSMNLSNFLKVYELNLIRDWDFLFYYKEKLNIDTTKSKCKQGLYQEIINTITSHNRFRGEGFTTCVIRHKYKTMITQDEVLLEGSLDIKDNCNAYSTMEIPLTSMYIEINNSNCYDFFKVVGIFELFERLNIKKNPEYEKILKNYSKDLEDKFVSHYEQNIVHLVNEIHTFIKKTDIMQIPSESGYIKINSINELDYGNMINHKNIFDTFACNLLQKQFLLSQYNNTLRIIRMYDKNLPKSNKIKKYLLSDINFKEEDLPNWILQDNEINELFDRFDSHLYKNLFEINQKEYDSTGSEDSIIKIFLKLDSFYSHTGIVTVYNKLRHAKSNHNLYNNLKNIIKKVFLKYIPNIPDKYYSTEFDKKIQKIQNGPNYTFKLFNELIKN